MATLPIVSSTIVIDANLAVWAVLPNVAEENVLDLFTDWHKASVTMHAPELWLAEATSVIRRLVYHKLISLEQGEAAMEDLFALGIETVHLDLELYQQAFKWAERLRQSKIYDSLYIALAEHLHAELWTADKRLVNAVNQLGENWIHWVGEYPA